LLPLKEWILLIIPVFRSSVIGLIIGILPGAGGDIAAFLSYNSAKLNSKHPEKYGKGSFEAIACTETANNALTGGSMIPLFTLSIPGTPTAAVLLGGLIMHGLVPGRTLFTDQAHIIYPVMLGFTLSNIVMCVVGLLLCRYIVKVTLVPLSILAPIIVVLGTIGSYAINVSMLDVWVMGIFGLIGYLMRKNDMIVAPIVLAIILGPLAETNLLRSFTIARGMPIFQYYMSRPICVILVILSAISIGWPIIQRKLAEKRKAKMNQQIT
jgi:putative tricarboxylic transport membrane protein